MGANDLHGRIAIVKAARRYAASVNESETIPDAQAFYRGRSGGGVLGHIERS
jgi:hypothetical protein